VQELVDGIVLVAAQLVKAHEVASVVFQNGEPRAIGRVVIVVCGLHVADEFVLESVGDGLLI
jgi:hypothetical protein